jgi:hypothetical protein
VAALEAGSGIELEGAEESGRTESPGGAQWVVRAELEAATGDERGRIGLGGDLVELAERARAGRRPPAQPSLIRAPAKCGSPGATARARAKVLWRLPYETRRAHRRLLSLDVEDVDLENRRAVVGSKGGDIELLHFQTGSARLLPRLIAGRACGPLFLTDRRPAPGRAAAFVGACPLTGRVRLSYRRAEEIFRDASGGWTLHQLRYSAITHLAEGNVGLALLMAKRSLAIRTKWRLPPRRRAGGCAPVLKASGPRPRSEAVAPPNLRAFSYAGCSKTPGQIRSLR